MGFFYLNPSFQIRQNKQTNKSLYKFVGARAVRAVVISAEGDRPSFIPEQPRICPCWLSLPQTWFKLLQNLDLFSGVSNHREKDDMLAAILEVGEGNANVFV